MTEREPWPLLPALDELLAREGWQDELDVVAAMELRIASETGVGRLEDEWLDGMTVPLTIDDQVRIATWKDSKAWKWPHPERSCGAPFLRSRDAAALLEEAVAEASGLDIEIRTSTAKGKPEAARRTRAALTAGWGMGMWPVKP